MGRAAGRRGRERRLLTGDNDTDATTGAWGRAARRRGHETTSAEGRISRVVVALRSGTRNPLSGDGLRGQYRRESSGDRSRVGHGGWRNGGWARSSPARQARPPWLPSVSPARAVGSDVAAQLAEVAGPAGLEAGVVSLVLRPERAPGPVVGAAGRPAGEGRPGGGGGRRRTAGSRGPARQDPPAGARGRPGRPRAGGPSPPSRRGPTGGWPRHRPAEPRARSTGPPPQSERLGGGRGRGWPVAARHPPAAHRSAAPAWPPAAPSGRRRVGARPRPRPSPTPRPRARRRRCGSRPDAPGGTGTDRSTRSGRRRGSAPPRPPCGRARCALRLRRCRRDPRTRPGSGGAGPTVGRRGASRPRRSGPSRGGCRHEVPSRVVRV